jgi:arylsulfatase A-like enzyme
MRASRPNILFIVVDDCGYADLGCTGQTDYRTPALDRLAAEGIRFTQAYANSALCTNTRVALITGRYQYRLPIGLVEPLRWSDREAPEMGVPPGFPTLPSLLRGTGYRTALIGKWHLGYLPRYSPLKSGYDEFFGVMGGFTGYYTHVGDGGEHDLYEGEIPIERPGYVTDILSERAVGWITAAAARPEPYFLSLHYTAPHWPWSAPSVEAAARQREVERTELTEGGNTRIYGEMMQSLDAGIGRVLDAIRQGPGDDNTLVVFTSDNGGERFSKIWPFVGRKFDLLEGGLRVPQICCWPGRIEPGRATDQVSITMDLTVLTGRAAEFERTLYWRMRHRYQRAVRRGGWKYLKVADNEYLFDIEYDPHERGDLSKKQPDLLTELRKQWEDWDRDMLPLPTSAVAPMSNLSAMLW